MTTDFRALCAELLMALENAISIIYCEDGTKHISTAKPIVNRARSALADEPASVISEPRHSEIRLLYCQTLGLRCDPDSIGNAPVTFARAVLAHWGNSAPLPLAEGEVAELGEGQ